MNQRLSLSAYIKNLGTQLQTQENWEMNEALEQLRSTYSYMLSFLAKGVEDPNAASLQLQLWQKAVSLQQRIVRQTNLRKNPRSRYAVALNNLRTDSELPNLLLQLELPYDPAMAENCMVKLFHRVWTSDQWHNADYEQAMQLLQSAKVPAKAKSVLVGSVMLALFEYFDSRKLTFLLDAYLTGDNDVSQRALTGIVLALRKEDERLEFYPEIRARLSILFDDETFVNHAYAAMIQLQMCAKTEEVANRVRDDIMPTIMKGSSMLKRQMGLLEINNKMSENGENPEWLHGDEKNDSMAEQKIREMVEMQVNGEDVYMASFSQMKNHRFFSEIAHWFYPYTEDDPALQGNNEATEHQQNAFHRMLLRNPPFCNSDKYSLSFLMASMDKQSRGFLNEQIEGKLAELEENAPDDAIEKLLNRELTPTELRRYFIFDLYRFFHLYSFRSEFYNPFKDINETLFSPLHIPSLKELTSSRSQLMNHADFLMRSGYYTQALSEFGIFEQSGEHSAELFQKMGFCDQKLRMWREAQIYYERADSIKPSSKWTLAHLGKVCFMQKDYAKALDCYGQISDMEPENANYLYRRADCLRLTGELQDAIDLLYKANYLDADSGRIRNLLGFCLVVNREYTKGIAFLDSTLEKSIAYIVAGKSAEAYTHLRQAYNEEKDSNQFVAHFQEAAKPYYESCELTPLQTELYLDACMADI